MMSNIKTIIQTISSESESKLCERTEISVDIIRMLHQLPSSIPKSCIYKVHSQLRAINEKAYEPVLVSIGPYHYEKRKNEFHSMEQHKLRYLGNLMKQRKIKEGISESDQLCEYLEILENLEDCARGYYEEAVTLDKYAFVKMLLLDGFFIIELFQRATWVEYSHERENDPLFKAGWMIYALKRDLILIENQIPFFILERMYSIIGHIPDRLALIYMSLEYLPIYKHISRSQSTDEYVTIAKKSVVDLCKEPFVKLPSTVQSRRLDQGKLSDFKHLLDLARKFMLVEETLEMKENYASPLEQKSKETTLPSFKKYAYSARELRELGVRFKGVEKRKFYDIRFENGVLEIPVILIEDITETHFRNMMAYEEHGHCHGETIYIGNYIGFMDGLISTAEDVELLRCHGIIDSLLGDDGEIATMFNNMGKNHILLSNYYGGIVQQLTDHCKKRRHVWMAKLRRNYLSSPWAIISVIAATFLLIFTIMQTIYTTLAYYY